MAGAMVLADLQSLVRHLVFEPSPADGLFTDAQLTAFIQTAHRRLWRLVAAKGPLYLTERSSDKTIPTTGYSFASTAVDAEGVHLIMRFEFKNDDGTYTPLDYLPIQDVGTTEDTSSEDNYDPTGWFVIGSTLHIYPKRTSSETGRFWYVPGAPEISSIVYPFDGRLPMFDDLVGYKAADMALTKDEKPSVYSRVVAEMERELLEHVSRQQAHQPRRVHESPWED